MELPIRVGGKGGENRRREARCRNRGQTVFHVEQDSSQTDTLLVEIDVEEEEKEEWKRKINREHQE